MWTTRVSNPVCSPHFRASASVKAQLAAFATGVPPNIYAFHRYTRNSANLYFTQETSFNCSLQVKPVVSQLTWLPACAPFTPSNSGQRLPPTYYRGCWHVVSRGLLLSYRHYSSLRTEVYNPKTVFLHAALLHQGFPIVQYSPLLPPVGVWAVSQSQCGRSTSQSGYGSSTW